MIPRLFSALLRSLVRTRRRFRIAGLAFLLLPLVRGPLPATAVSAASAGSAAPARPAVSPAPTSSSASARPGKLRLVRKVIDGDTVLLDGEERVRLLGIDAPEWNADPGPLSRSPEEGAHEATEFLRTLVEGKRVRLEQDWQKEDSYRRTLGYLLREDGSCVNEELLRAGWAFVFTRFPFARIDAFRAAEEEAQRNGSGLWGRALKAPVLAAEDAIRNRGRSLRVEGEIRRVRSAGRTSLVEFEGRGASTFTALIYPEDRKFFPPDPGAAWSGKRLRVIGRIEGEHAWAEMVLRSDRQVEVFEKEPLVIGGVHPPEEASRYVGHLVTIEGTVLSAIDAGRTVCLLFGVNPREDFRAVVFAQSLPLFPPDPARYYRGKRLRVRGILQRVEGRPEIVLEDPSQVEFLE